MQGRKNIAERVSGACLNCDLEFNTLREMVNNTIRSQFDESDWLSMTDDFVPHLDDDFTMVSVRDLWRFSFVKFPMSFRGTCRKIEDFNVQHGFDFEKPGRGPTSKDYLLSYCEYVMTLTWQLSGYWTTRMGVIPDRIREHVELVLDKLGHVGHKNDCFFIALPKDERADQVAASVPETLGDKIRHYRHRSMHGKIDAKRGVLVDLAQHLEPSRTELKKFCPVYESSFFAGVNNLNVRHNNLAGGPNYNEKLTEIGKVELEQAYDTLFDIAIRLIEVSQLKPSIEGLARFWR